MAELPSTKKTFLVTSAASAVISILNKQQFITETREFAFSYFFASLYYAYVWFYEYLKEGRRLKNTKRFPNLRELLCLFINVFWVGTSGFWAYWSTSEAGLEFGYIRTAVGIVYGFYGGYMQIKHSPGGWQSVRDFIEKILHPYEAILREIDDEALEKATAAVRAMSL